MSLAEGLPEIQKQVYPGITEIRCVNSSFVQQQSSTINSNLLKTKQNKNKKQNATQESVFPSAPSE